MGGREPDGHRDHRDASSCSSCILTARRLHIAGKAFAARVRQGFTILRTPRRYALLVALPQLLGWACRVGAAAAFLEAFGIPGTLRNALLVMVVGSLTTLLPFTPGGVGTQQALIVVVLSGAATDSQLLSFSVGAQAAVVAANAIIGGIALVLMLRTFSLRSAIGHARHTQRRGQALSALSSRRRGLRRNAVAPPLAGWRTLPWHGRPSSPSARSALRPTATVARGRSRSISSPSTSAPARNSPTAGVRFESGAPGRCGCAGTTFQSTVSAAMPSVASVPCTIVPDCSAQPSGRTLVASNGAPQPMQRALGRERDAREAAAGVAHRLAHQQQRRAPRARVQVGRGVGAPERRAVVALERGVGVAEHAEGRAERALGDALDEVARTRPRSAPRPGHRRSRRRARAPR